MSTAHHAHEIAKTFPAITSHGESNGITFSDFSTTYAASIQNPSAFWLEQALEKLDWFIKPTVGLEGDFDAGDVRWFSNGQLNVCYNAIDRHVQNGKANEIAMVWEGDEPTDVLKLTFLQVQRRVSQIANVLKRKGIGKGDVVTIYMPMVVELPLTMLACARIGAIHSVVFAGFSSEALAQRIVAAQSKCVMTANVSSRGGKMIPLLDIVSDARTKPNVEDTLQYVFVWERGYTADQADVVPEYLVGKEGDTKMVRMNVLVDTQRPYCVVEPMNAEDPLFLLYTSGSTGKPKGLVHTTGGYALYAAFTTKTTFDLRTGDLFACVADCGWITGHTYVVYGPLLNGCPTFIFESTPVYPTPARYWEMIQRHSITQFYTAPTAIRLLMRYGDDIPNQFDLPAGKLRVLGTVGEPINPEAWRWYYETVGRSQCTVVDTYWQTETGGHILTNLPGITPMKPGSCTLGTYGIDTVVLDPVSGKEATEPDEKGNVQGVMAIRQPWPGMARTCLDDHGRYLQTYLHVYKGYYFTGDSVVRDKDGFHFIIGRVDDVLNVSGHRIGTAEVESALVAHPDVAQAAVVGKPHEIKGQAIAAFVMLKAGKEESDTLLKELKENVRADIGKFATPDLICVAPSLPMTRSGKIMRRILRKIVCDEVDSLGDTSTLADPSIVDTLIAKVASLQGK